MDNIFVKLQWKGNPLEPYIFYSELDTDRINEMKLSVGKSLHFEILDNYHCIGSEVGRGVWQTCFSRNGKNRVVNKRTKQCSNCKISNFFDCRMTCVGKFCNPSSSKAKEICQPVETEVYLTNVGGKNKVGVSLHAMRRWVEQGSDFAVHLGTFPGLEARKLEQKLAKELDVSLQVRVSSKIKNISQAPSEVEFNSKIDAAKMITADFASKNEGFGNDQIKVNSLGKYYGESVEGQFVEEITIENNKQFGGVIIGVKGDLLLLKRDKRKFVVNMKKMISRTFRFIENSSMEVKGSLDDWF